MRIILNLTTSKIVVCIFVLFSLSFAFLYFRSISSRQVDLIKKDDALVDSNTKYENSVGMEFVTIPAGPFLMGSEDREPNEKPIHQVIIEKPLLMEKYEVTQDQWKSVMGNSPSKFTNCTKCPVEQVSWNDVQKFLLKLNSQDDRFVYRLPDEFEWEYACRAGSSGDYYGDIDSIAWHYGNSDNRTHEVGQKKPNAFGLYDMSGNVSEWTANLYGSYTDTEIRYQRGPGLVELRVIRGGSWTEMPNLLRSAYRNWNEPAHRSSSLGFRVVAKLK